MAIPVAFDRTIGLQETFLPTLPSTKGDPQTSVKDREKTRTTDRSFPDHSIVLEGNGSGELFIDHKSTGFALANHHRDRVEKHVAFANLQSATPVFMINRSVNQIDRKENKKICKIVTAITRRFPESKGFTQPLIFDRHGADITNFFK